MSKFTGWKAGVGERERGGGTFQISDETCVFGSLALFVYHTARYGDEREVVQVYTEVCYIPYLLRHFCCMYGPLVPMCVCDV